MQTGNKNPKGFGDGSKPPKGIDIPHKGRNIRYQQVAENYPVRMPANKALPFIGMDTTKTWGVPDAWQKPDYGKPDIDFEHLIVPWMQSQMEGGRERNENPPDEWFHQQPYVGVNEMWKKTDPWHTLNHDQIRELAWQPNRPDRRAIYRKDFGIDNKGFNVPFEHLMSILSSYNAGRRNDAKDYDRRKNENMTQWLDDLKMDKILGVDWLTHKIPADDPNREAKVAYMDSVAKAYKNNAEFFRSQQENHRVANQTATMREMLAKRRGTTPDNLSVDPITGKTYINPVNANEVTPDAHMEKNPIWGNIAHQMAGGAINPTGTGVNQIDPSMQDFFGSNRPHWNNYYTQDDYGPAANVMNILADRLGQIGDSGPSAFEASLLRNEMRRLAEDGPPLPLMGHTFQTGNTKKLFPTPSIVNQIPAAGSTKETKEERARRIKSEVRGAGKEFTSEWGKMFKGMPLSGKLAVPIFAGTSIGALTANQMRRNAARNAPPSQPWSMDNHNRGKASDLGPVKGRHLTNLRKRFEL